MRKRTALKAAIVKPAEVTHTSLSMEEELIALSEAAVNSGEADLALQMVDRMTDIAQGVEDVQIIKTSTKGPVSQTDAALTESVGDMIVAGTDADSSSLFPSVDPTTTNILAVESFVDKIKSIWDQIVEMVKKALDAIKGFFVKMFSAVESQRNRAANQLKRAEKLTASNPLKPFTKLTLHDPNGFFHNPSNADDRKTQQALHSEIGDNNEFVKKIYKEYPRALCAAGISIVNALNKFDAHDTTQWMAESGEEIRKNVLAMAKSIESSLARWKMSSLRVNGKSALIYCSTSVLGSMWVGTSETLYLTRATGDEILTQISNFRFTASDKVLSKSKDEKYDISFNEVFTLNEIRTSLKEIVSMLDSVLLMRNGEGAKLLKEGVGEIKRAGDAAIQKLNGNKEAEKDLSRVIKLATTYSHWVHSPLTNVTKRVVMYLSALTGLNEKMMAYYE